MRTFKVVYRSPGVKKGQELGGDALWIEAANEKAARREARAILARIYFGRCQIAWVDERPPST